MSFFRSVLLASLISLLVAIALLFLGFSMGYEEFRSGYAVITTDASVEDRHLRSLLDTSALFFVGEPISESSQWVMLDVFDSLERVPLDTYSSRVFPFDPRNDGYADKIREVFVKDGKRYVYMPIMAGNWDTGLLNRKFDEILINIPYTVDYFGLGRPLALFFIVYAAASAILLFLCYINRKIHRSIVNIIPMIPVLSSLCFFGAAGIGCAALLFALFIILKEPLGDLVNPPAPLAKDFYKRMNQLYKEIIIPYRYYWFFLPVFIAGFTVLIIFTQLKFLFLLAAIAASFAVFFFSLKIVSFSGVEHKRFNPVTIMKRSFPEYVFPVYILAFVAGAFITMFFTPYMSGTYGFNKRFDILVDEQDYNAHILFQASFSTVQMGTSSAAFPAFIFDKDGLPSVDSRQGGQNIRLSDYPQFPLKYLMEFFNNVNNGDRLNTQTGSSSGGISERLSLIVLLIFLFPGILKQKEKSGKTGESRFKKISTKLRSAGINWNNNLIYNNKKMIAGERTSKI